MVTWNYVIESIPDDTTDVLVLFDDGSFCEYDNEQWPFAEVIAWGVDKLT